jgi:hypothetical protein
VYDPADYHYVPALPKDNPHLNWAEYNRELSRLPKELRDAYRDGLWDCFAGQFFPEFQRARHVLTEEEAERTYRLGRAYLRDAAMQWGYARDGVIIWMVLADDGTLIVEDEMLFNGRQRNKFVVSEVAEQALERVHEHQWTVRRWLANPKMGEQRGHDGGETQAETCRRSGVPVRLADDDRVNGWGRLRAWMRTNPKTGKPFLRVHPRCVMTIRSIGDVVQAENDEDDIDVEGPDFAVNALRYAVMGRPSPAQEAPQVRYAPDTVGALIAKVRQDAQPQGRVLGRSNQSKRVTRY